jgi:hypothetical protein
VDPYSCFDRLAVDKIGGNAAGPGKHKPLAVRATEEVR